MSFAALPFIQPGSESDAQAGLLATHWFILVQLVTEHSEAVMKSRTSRVQVEGLSYDGTLI